MSSGHIGVEGHEKADKKAHPFMGPEPTGANTIRTVLKDNQRTRWARHWAEHSGMRQAKM